MSTRIKIRASDDRGNTWERSSDGNVAKLMDDLPWVRLLTGPVGAAGSILVFRARRAGQALAVPQRTGGGVPEHSGIASGIQAANLGT